MLKKYFKSLLAIILIATLGGFFLLYFQYQEKHPSTDNAYIQAHIVYMASQIDATAQKVLIKDHQQQQSQSEIEQVYQGLNERIQSTAILSNSEATALYEIQKLPYRRARDLYQARLEALQKKGTSVYFGTNDLGDKQTLLKPFIQEGLKRPLFKIIINQKDNKIDSFIATISYLVIVRQKVVFHMNAASDLV